MKLLKIKKEYLEALASLLESGISSVDSLVYLKKYIKISQQPILTQMIKVFESGGDYVKVFSHTTLSKVGLYQHIIKTSQSNGSIPSGLRDIYNHIDKVQKNKQTLFQVLLYPIIVSVVLGILIVGILIFIIPQIRPIIQVSGVVLPLPTLILIFFSNIVRFHMVEIGICIILIFVVLLFLYQKQKIRQRIVYTSTKIIGIGPLVKSHIWATISSIIFYYLKSGMDIRSSCLIVSKLPYLPQSYKKDFDIAIAQLNQGKRLSESFADSDNLPDIWHLQLKIGEVKSGYEMAMSNLERIHHKDIQNYTQSLQKIIEPALMVSIGIVVGLCAYAILLPIYSLVQSIQS